MSAIAGSLGKIKAEAERLEVMDKAAGIMAELLYTDQLLTQIEEYRPIMLHVSTRNTVMMYITSLMTCLSLLLAIQRHRR